ncbi:peptidase C48, SUMO/sentrin/Ubl1 [Tanacetum coccineum]
MRGLSPERKKVIREMGFGDLIEFPIFEIPTKLAFYFVDILNTKYMTLECPMGDIVISPKTVKQVLGLPMGRRRLEREGQREYNNPFLLQWKDQFKNVNKLTIKVLSDVIIETKNFDYMFRMNILTLIANTLGSRENNSTVNFTVLKNVFEGDDVSDIDLCSYIIEYLTYLHYKKFDMLKLKRRLPAFKSWNTSLLKKREIAELQNDYMGIEEIQDDVGEGEEPNQKEELYEMLEENIHNILIEKSEIEEKINENLIKFQDDEKLLQLKQRMKEIFKEPDMPEYLSSSSSESDDDNDDGSQLADENEERTETSKKDEANNNKEEGVANTKAKNQKIVGEVQNDGRNENQNIAECSEKKMNKKRGLPKKMKLITNEEEIIRKGREFSAEIIKKAQQQEREQKIKGKKEKDQIGSSSQESPVFGIDNSLQGSQPTFDLGASPTYEKMNILNEKKKKMGLKSKYVNKTVDPAVELTADEKLLGRSIFSTQEEEEEVVFNDDEHTILFRRNIQSLAPRIEIDTSAFFPIIAHGHYYLIVFNLKTGKPVIIDNNESDATYEGKYKDNVEFVRSKFGRHLLMYQNTNADKILKGPKKATNLRMKWKTTKEKIDCGLYMIMHMELYEGSTAAQWKTGLLPENDKNHRMQMDNLRSRIAAKILLDEVNIYQKKMSDYTKKITEASEGGSNRE